MGMRGRQWWDELICILCLGIGTTCVMTGYDTQSFIVESVLHSVHLRQPTAIDGHAGYYGQAVLYAVYALATLFAPWVCLRIGAKWSLFSGSLLFTAYQLGFFYLNSYYFYLTQALMGIGFALYYAGQGLYMSEHSSRSTLTRNSTLVSAIGQSSMLFGGIALAIISYVRQMSTTDSEKTADLTDDGYRNFSNGEIHVIYGVLLGFTVLSNIIFALTPTKATSDAKMDAVEKTTLRTQLGHLFNAAREPRIFLLSFFFIFYGLHVSFWLGAYPTSFAFSKILSANVYLPAYYSAMTGVGNIIVGVYISFFDKRYPNFGLIPTMITQLVLGTITFGITIASTSNLSTIQTNDDRSMWIEPSTFICCMLGILHGMIDCCSCTMRAVICTIAVPRMRLQVYSLAKLYQSAASCAAFFFSPYLTVRLWIAILIGSQMLSALGFICVASQVTKGEHQEEKQTAKDAKIHPAEIGSISNNIATQ